MRIRRRGRTAGSGIRKDVYLAVSAPLALNQVPDLFRADGRRNRQDERHAARYPQLTTLEYVRAAGRHSWAAACREHKHQTGYHAGL